MNRQIRQTVVLAYRPAKVARVVGGRRGESTRHQQVALGAAPGTLFWQCTTPRRRRPGKGWDNHLNYANNKRLRSISKVFRASLHHFVFFARWPEEHQQTESFLPFLASNFLRSILDEPPNGRLMVIDPSIVWSHEDRNRESNMWRLFPIQIICIICSMHHHGDFPPAIVAVLSRSNVLCLRRWCGGRQS